ncbi:MAG: 30S ribosomal protein S19e [Candidatus Methanomethylicia archaeon]|nr:30S ribosomal protein S19e [Candidatus Methanomethylicia archaeon]MCX8169301.1 30S ribosomal protein S19e [Candidatus Methanomethylicia archaeon]MDW7988916.1 30S ribosomal protein S19e [Nitrososphaerota archaeon]
MVSPKEVPANRLIIELANILKNDYPQIKPPPWALYIKTGVHRERVPDYSDWWYIRASAILRKIFLRGIVGVERLRTAFGGRKQIGTRKCHFRKGGGSIISEILQQLEEAKLVKKIDSKGRTLTPEGLSLLYRTSNKVFRSIVKETPELKKYII